MSIGTLVRTTTVELSSTTSLIPTAAQIAFSVFHRIHRFWRWIRLGQIYSDPNNFAQLAAGHGVNYLLDKSILIRISAISVLIATRILHCVDEYEKLQNSWLKMKQSFSNQFPTIIDCSWDQGTAKGFFSVSTVIWIKTTTKTILSRIQWVAICIFKVGKYAFLLSMRLVDTVEAFSLNPSIRNEGINLLFVNSSTCMSKLVDNRDLLLKSLESNQEVIQKVFEGLGTKLTTEQLTQTVEAALEKTGSFHRSTRTVNQHIGEFVTACGKKWTYEFFREIGLRHMVPKSMVHPTTLPWAQPRRRKITKRFPPEASITQPTKPKPPKAVKAPIKKQKKPPSDFAGVQPLPAIVVPRRSPSSSKGKKQVFGKMPYL